MATKATDIANRRYEQCVKASKKVRWDIDADVIRGRRFDYEMSSNGGAKTGKSPPTSATQPWMT